MKIIGLSGKIQSGKTTVAEYLEINMPCEAYAVTGFSDGLKKMFYRDFGPFCQKNGVFFASDLNRQDIKNLPFYRTTVRDALQRYGRFFRELNPDFWIEKWKAEAASFSDHVVILVQDVRYPNEVRAIQDTGGIVIRLTRNPVDGKDETEVALDFVYPAQVVEDMQKYPCIRHVGCKDFVFDWLVDNSVLSIDETNAKVLAIAKEYLG